MTDQELKKDLAEHKIFSAWQFIANTRANINVANYCDKTFDAVVKRMSDEAHKTGAEMTEKILKHESVVFGEIPEFSTDIAGNTVDSFFLAQKLIRDFYQSLRNSFDGMGQIANAGLLANNGKKIDRTDFPAMRKVFEQKTYSMEFPKTSSWFKQVSQDDEFRYIDAVCNRIKHTAFINNQISIGLFGYQNKLNMGSFFRDGEQHEKIDLKKQMETVLSYTVDSFNSFMTAFGTEYVKDLHVKGRYNYGIKVYQQFVKGDELSSFSVPYLVTNCSFAEMPEKIYLLLLSNNDNQRIEAKDSPFTSILITSDNDYKTAIGSYTADPDDRVGIDSIVKYRAYKKDENILDPSLAMIKVMNDGRGKLYRWNKFFDLQSISEDEDFLKKVSIPF